MESRLRSNKPGAAVSGTPRAPHASECLELLAALGHDALVASEAVADGASGEESVVLASFADRRGAEHMVASLGRGFRKQHRKGHAMAFVIRRNEDGSLKLTQSRVVSAGGVVYTGMRVSLSVAIGFIGMLSMLRGAKGAVKDVHGRGSHVGADEQKAHAILARVGPHSALLLIGCDDHETRHAAMANAADQASESWEFSRAEFLADLDPGPKHDWVRTALGEPASTTG